VKCAFSSASPIVYRWTIDTLTIFLGTYDLWRRADLWYRKSFKKSRIQHFVYNLKHVPSFVIDSNGISIIFYIVPMHTSNFFDYFINVLKYLNGVSKSFNTISMIFILMTLKPLLFCPSCCYYTEHIIYCGFINIVGLYIRLSHFIHFNSFSYLLTNFYPFFHSLFIQFTYSI
jgi:hypothetical protein